MPDNEEFDFNDENDEKVSAEAEKLRQRIKDMYKKLTGENSDVITHDDLLQYMRVINFNFVALVRLIQGIQLKHLEMDATLIGIETSVKALQIQLQQFFNDSSMIDTILERPNDVSDSKDDGRI